MNEQKEIEEIKQVLVDCAMKKNLCFSFEAYHTYAKTLYGAGYRKTVSCKNLTERNPVDEFICSECGFTTEEFFELRIDEDNDRTHHEYEIKYCPNCGAKVKDK